MKKTILAAALAVALPLMQQPAWAQAVEQQKDAAAKPAEAAKPAPNAKAVRTAHKATAKRHQDARHCLERPNNDAIIRCAEEYL
jgi:hypothetical protein